MTPKAFIFDLDGTIFYTGAEMAQVGNRIFRSLGMKELPVASYMRYSGLGNGGFFTGLLRESGGVEALSLVDTYEPLYTAYEAEAAKTDALFPYEGIPEVLRALKNRGYKIAVYSNKGHDACTGSVEMHLGSDLFDLIQGFEPGMKSKPDPSGGLLISKKLGVKPEECVYVGDTEVDIQTGKSAGFYTVAVLWGYRTKEYLEGFHPDLFIKKPEELLDLKF